MKSILETFKKSLYSPAFYRAVAEAPFGDAFRYYIKTAFILAVFMTIALAVFLSPHLIRFIKDEAPVLVKKYYADELVVTIKNGEVSVNVAEPYIIPARDGAKDALKSAMSPVENILVIDTKNDFNREQFERYQTLILLTKSEIVTEGNGQITIQDIGKVPDMVIDQSLVLSEIAGVANSLYTFIPVGVVLAFIGLFFGFTMYLVPVLLFALIPFLLAWIKRTPLTYAGAYKMSLHAVVPGLVLKTLLNSVGVFSVPGYLVFLIFLLIISLNMREVEQPKLFNS